MTPHGDGLLFLVNCTCHDSHSHGCAHSIHLVGSYCIFIVNTLVSVGLLLIHVKGYSAFQWNPPVRAPRIIVILYFVCNVLLLIVPFIPPTEGRPTYRNLPYWVSDITLLPKRRAEQGFALVPFCHSLCSVAYRVRILVLFRGLAPSDERLHLRKGVCTS